MKIFWSCLFLILSLNTFSQNTDKELKKLVKQITADAKTDRDKAEAFHDWIAKNIAYDTKAYLSGKIHEQNLENTLKTRRTLCSGFSELFTAMCDEVGIRSEVVEGYSRGYGFDLFNREDPMVTNHAWNAVNLDGSWYLLDVTWDAGFMEGKRFKLRYSTHYLFRKPEEMIFTHYPVKTYQQFLERPLNAYEFTELPFLHGRFFDEKLRLLSRPERLVEMSLDQDYVFEMEVPKDRMVNVLLVGEDRQKRQDCVWVNRNGNKATIRVRFPKKGQWKAYMMSKTPEEKLYTDSGRIGFEVRTTNNDYFPLAYSPFQKELCTLNTPLKKTLNRGETINIDVLLPNYILATIIVNGKWIPLESVGGNRYVLTYTVPNDAVEVILYGDKSKSGEDYTSLIKWEVK